MADHLTDADVAQVVRDAEDAARALIGGDVERYLELVHHAEGYTLLPPDGGAPVRYEARAESVRASAGFFKSGEASLEHVETHAWGDTVVLVMIERQHPARDNGCGTPTAVAAPRIARGGDQLQLTASC